MAKITHYEVYSDRGNGWKLENRYSADQRAEAFALAKDRERSGLAVKIIRETFDVHDGSYTETIEYIGGLANKVAQAKNSSIKVDVSASTGFQPYPKKKARRNAQASSTDLLWALFKLLVIVFLTLVFANIMVTLLEPVVEMLVDEALRKRVMFGLFFSIFLILSVPLIVTKIPWEVFGMKSDQKFTPSKERRISRKAENLINLYNFNEKYEEAIAPSYPEASINDKKHIVKFLSSIVSGLEKADGIKDSFSKFGVKLVVYGGCLELARDEELGISEANSLLFEAFKIIDGDAVDVEAFYEGKRSFKNNRTAIFLTGVGAHFMAQTMRDREIDKNLLKASFSKWQSQNQTAPVIEKVRNEPQKSLAYACKVNVLTVVKQEDSFDDTGKQYIPIIRDEIKNIVYKTAETYGGKEVKNEGSVVSVSFKDLLAAFGFGVELFENLYSYQADLNDENIIVENKCNIVSAETETALINDLFDHSYDDEIMVVEAIKKVAGDSRYRFEHLGAKNMPHSGKTVSLYKLTHE